VPTLADLPPALLVGVAVSLGLVFGSFLNVVIHRLPQGQSIASPGSRCPACGTPIRAWQNVPVVSWLLLRGKARCCGARISPRYPLVELLSALLAWALLQTVVAGLPLDTPWWRVLVVFALYLSLGLGLIAAAFIDLEHMFLPDEITIGGTVLGLASVPLRPDAGFVAALGGAAVGFLVIWLPFDVIYRALRGRPGMGLGDAKLLALTGAWFGWQGALFALLAGAVQGTLVALALFLAQGRIEEPIAVRKEREEIKRQLVEASPEERREIEEALARDPVGDEPEPGLGKARLSFGPFLVLATLEYLFFGKWLLEDTLRIVWPG
jgi:leader peptidase (prepilin peptidase)/N-methyltransferase